MSKSERNSHLKILSDDELQAWRVRARKGSRDTWVHNASMVWLVIAAPCIPFFIVAKAIEAARVVELVIWAVMTAISVLAYWCHSGRKYQLELWADCEKEQDRRKALTGER